MADSKFTESEGVLTVTFTRDTKLNAVNAGMLEMLRRAVDSLGSREDANVLVITGEGRHFTAGMDIFSIDYDSGIGANGQKHGTLMRRNYRKLHTLFDEIESIEKPVVLAAQGPCRGFGVELGSSCDFRLASEDAIFGLPEIANLGVLPGSGGISRLTRLVGPHWARWLAMAGQEIDAREAYMIGFVHAVYPRNLFLEKVDAFAHHLASLPPEAVGLAKLAIDAAASTDRTTARDFDRVANTQLLMSEYHLERIEGFKQDRNEDHE
jgi:enoyl-CoA hydratase